MVWGMTKLNTGRVESNPVAMGILGTLADADSETDGYTIMTNPNENSMGGTWTYAQAKTALQMLRDEGFLKVTQMGKAGKAKWVAYQTFWFSDEALEWWQSRTGQADRAMEERFKAFAELAGRVQGKRAKLGVKYFDDMDLRAVVRLGVAAGFAKVTLELTEIGVEWLAAQEQEAVAQGKAGIGGTG